VGLFFYYTKHYICLMFKTDEQIQDIVIDAKAYLYEQAQTIGVQLSKTSADNLYDEILNNGRYPLNLVKAISFIGATANNKLSDKLQQLIMPPQMDKEYVENGYVTQGYVISNQ